MLSGVARVPKKSDSVIQKTNNSTKSTSTTTSTSSTIQKTKSGLVARYVKQKSQGGRVAQINAHDRALRNMAANDPDLVRIGLLRLKRQPKFESQEFNENLKNENMRRMKENYPVQQAMNERYNYIGTGRTVEEIQKDYNSQYDTGMQFLEKLHKECGGGQNTSWSDMARTDFVKEEMNTLLDDYEAGVIDNVGEFLYSHCFPTGLGLKRFHSFCSKAIRDFQIFADALTEENMESVKENFDAYMEDDIADEKMKYNIGEDRRRLQRMQFANPRMVLETGEFKRWLNNTLTAEELKWVPKMCRDVFMLCYLFGEFDLDGKLSKPYWDGHKSYLIIGRSWKEYFLGRAGGRVTGIKFDKSKNTKLDLDTLYSQYDGKKISDYMNKQIKYQDGRYKQIKSEMLSARSDFNKKMTGDPKVQPRYENPGDETSATRTSEKSAKEISEKEKSDDQTRLKQLMEELDKNLKSNRSEENKEKFARKIQREVEEINAKYN